MTSIDIEHGAIELGELPHRRSLSGSTLHPGGDPSSTNHAAAPPSYSTTAEPRVIIEHGILVRSRDCKKIVIITLLFVIVTAAAVIIFLWTVYGNKGGN